MTGRYVLKPGRKQQWIETRDVGESWGLFSLAAHGFDFSPFREVDESWGLISLGAYWGLFPWVLPGFIFVSPFSLFGNGFGMCAFRTDHMIAFTLFIQRHL